MRIRNERDANNAIAETHKERIAQQVWEHPSKRVYEPMISVVSLMLWVLSVCLGAVFLLIIT